MQNKVEIKNRKKLKTDRNQICFWVTCGFKGNKIQNSTEKYSKCFQSQHEDTDKKLKLKCIRIEDILNINELSIQLKVQKRERVHWTRRKQKKIIMIKITTKKMNKDGNIEKPSWFLEKTTNIVVLLERNGIHTHWTRKEQMQGNGLCWASGR